MPESMNDTQYFKMPESDRILASCSDELCKVKSAMSTPNQVPLELLFRKFRESRISLEKLLPLLNIFNESDKNNLAIEAHRDRLYREKWFQKLTFVCNLLNNSGIQYIFIKILDYPYAQMSDLDILILNPEEELKALGQLVDQGFKIFGFRLLAHPLKLMALRMDDIDPKIAVDFYPSPAWIRKKIGDNEVIFSRAQITYIGGREAKIPSPEDSLYLIGTHSYNHLRFTFAEILHGLNTINGNFDWQYLFNLTRVYGTADSIYLYLRLIDIYSREFRHCSSVPEHIFKPYQKSRICRKIDSWLETSRGILEFPVYVPTKIGCVYSSLYHCKTIGQHIPISDLLCDFTSHYLSLFSKLTLGKT
ncbi:MAG: nucleotidyltransferase family protein [Candidatus Bathyarchaeota archaeon]|nr:nucleotidyltransferase family protein [Candidatus Bathyarchaeota archaeon]